jgi:succinyl-CoA synthetase alpha subunit
MYHRGIEGFPYYLGIRSLADIATRAGPGLRAEHPRRREPHRDPDQPCLLRRQRGLRHLAGTRGPGAEDARGHHPGLQQRARGAGGGHAFDTGVVYLPPSGVRDGVAELIRVNPDLRKIVIITEKIAVHDAREIRAMAQANGVDIIGGNCLGVADSWNRVRIGGALGGDHPEEALLKGSVAIFSNSGGFTTTIAQYLGTAGWGTTTLISSGKDVYIHYAAPDFAHAFGNDDRSKAAVLYVEPGGYYEHGIAWTKPTVACVVGRWKSKLTRAVGHAGAMAGSGDAPRTRSAGSWRPSACRASSPRRTRWSPPRAPSSPTSPTSPRR